MVVLVNCFKVASGREDEFFALWREVNSYMRSKTGFLSHRLHRSIDPGAPYRFINVAHWHSLTDFNNAHDDGFRTLVGDSRWKEFPSTPTVCEVFHEANTAAAD